MHKMAGIFPAKVEAALCHREAVPNPTNLKYNRFKELSVCSNTHQSRCLLSFPLGCPWIKATDLKPTEPNFSIAFIAQSLMSMQPAAWWQVSHPDYICNSVSSVTRVTALPIKRTGTRLATEQVGSQVTEVSWNFQWLITSFCYRKNTI